MKKYLLLSSILLATACNSGEQITTTQIEEAASRIVEYSPAPGQFINDPVSGFGRITTPDQACTYAEGRLKARFYVSLGGWGGYLVAAFATPVPNTGDYELYIEGNQFADSSEPGVVYVAQDADGDQRPDAWFELRGSEHTNPKTIRNYRITYHRPTADNQPVTWEDNQGDNGTIDRIADHTQASYFPEWVSLPEAGKLTLSGVRLPDNVVEGQVDDNGNPVSGWIVQPFAWGYADNYASSARKGMTTYFRISDAVTATGQPANLSQISFIKIQTGVNAKAPQLGEVSTEVCGIGCLRTVTTGN